MYRIYKLNLLTNSKKYMGGRTDTEDGAKETCRVLNRAMHGAMQGWAYSHQSPNYEYKYEKDGRNIKI